MHNNIRVMAFRPTEKKHKRDCIELSGSCKVQLPSPCHFSSGCGHQRRQSKWAELWCRHILFAFSSATASASTSWSYISHGRTSCGSHQRQRAGLGRLLFPPASALCLLLFCALCSPKPKSCKARTGLGRPCSALPGPGATGKDCRRCLWKIYAVHIHIFQTPHTRRSIRTQQHSATWIWTE